MLFALKRALSVMGFGVASVASAMALSDQLLSPNFFASQGALTAIRNVDALSWVQSPALLGDIKQTHLSTGTFLVYPSLNPLPQEKSARGAAVLGFAAPTQNNGVFGVALSMPLGQNVWVDTGSRESSALFSLSRMSAFSLALGWGKRWDTGWAWGFQIPILFRSNTTTDIYLTDENPHARARTGVQPYLGWQVGVKYEVSENSHWALSYREEQASKIEFGVKGEVDFASITLPLDASGLSQILFEPRRADFQFQQRVSSWLFGVFGRWSNWKSAPPLGLVIDSKIPNVTTDASRIDWQDQWEIATAVAKTYGAWTPVVSYRFRSRAVVSSNDYWDYNEHIGAVGVHVEALSDELWVSAAVRLHKLVGNGTLTSVLAGLDWAL